MMMTLAEMRFCFRASLLDWYREEQKRYEGYAILSAVLGSKENPFEEIQSKISETIDVLMINNPKAVVNKNVITDATIRNQIRQAGIPFSQVRKDG